MGVTSKEALPRGKGALAVEVAGAITLDPLI